LNKLTNNSRVILIGGSSHSGKSTLARALGEKLGWTDRSTDYLARHPGRPWKRAPDKVPEHVAEHYSTLKVDELIQDVTQHYQNLWPRIRGIITTHATDTSVDKLVLEGSALLPQNVVTLELAEVSALWLTASDGFFKTRIYKESNYENVSTEGKHLIDKFVERTQLFNKVMMGNVSELSLPYIDVEKTSSLAALVDEALAKLKGI